MIRNYLPPQTAFLKLNLLTIIEKDRLYGLQILKELQGLYEKHHYRIKHEHVYRTLHELVHDGYLIQEKEKVTEFQEVIYYRFSTAGREMARIYRENMKEELNRSIGLLQEAVKVNY
ncbi:helix-turn-helix transcriptional regulator [Paenibacillus sp. IITD108]|uniref:helix-turn-helix transcriptional regulator n=1 Tax=Paenibacillus sp. IITD108 TaxID=3116649 RepID=UPI002F41DF8D